MKFYIDKTGESVLCTMCRAENETISLVNVRYRPKTNTKKAWQCMQVYSLETMQKNMAFKKYHSGASMSQMKLLRTRVTRFIEILQSGVIPRLKINNTILLLLVKSRRKLRS